MWLKCGVITVRGYLMCGFNVKGVDKTTTPLFHSGQGQ